MQARKVVSAPKRAQPTAWLLPLPPWNSANSFPSTVSPGPGALIVRMDRPTAYDPTTAILAFTILISNPVCLVLIHYNTTDGICTYSGVTRLKGNLFTSELNTHPDVRAMVKRFSPLDNQYFPQLPN